MEINALEKILEALDLLGKSTTDAIRDIRNGIAEQKPPVFTGHPTAPTKAQCSAVNHPMLGRRCVCRTYSAGVHIGDVVWVNPENSMEAMLSNALRLWEWKKGGLSLSVVANNGIKGGRLNRTGDVFLTNVIEYIPTTKSAEETYVKFIEY